MTSHTYVTVAELRNYLDKAPSSQVPTELFQSAIDTATAAIDDMCGRSFITYEDEARLVSAEVYDVDHGSSFIQIDDVVGETVKVEMADSPDVEVWTVLNDGWWLGPLRKKPNFPYTELWIKHPRMVEGRTLRITTDWGWVEVPDTVKRACLMLSARYYQRKQSPLGQENVSAEFGTVFVRRTDPDIQNMLRPYKRQYLTAW